MDIERLSKSPVGSITRIFAPDPVSHEVVEGHAFLPARLPRDLSLSTSTWNMVNTATAALARLDGAARLIPNPELLRRPTLRREAQSTSALEGTYAPFADVLAADEDEQPATAELREVLNFERMAQIAFSWPAERRITLSMLGELQAILVAGTPGQLSDSGGLRTRVVMIGARGRGLDEARYVPPPDGDWLHAEVESLLDWIHRPPALPTVVQAALAHYQFESLHPYSDGNGRIGRLLVIVQLLREALIREPLLVVSPWFEERREVYQDALLELSCSGDWDKWIAFFAEGVAASASLSQEKVERLVSLQTALRAQVQAAGKRGVAERLAADLVGRPYVDRRWVRQTYEVSGQGAANAINTLLDLGLLQPASVSKHGQIYVAREVVRVISE